MKIGNCGDTFVDTKIKQKRQRGTSKTKDQSSQLNNGRVSTESKKKKKIKSKSSCKLITIKSNIWLQIFANRLPGVILIGHILKVDSEGKKTE